MTWALPAEDCGTVTEGCKRALLSSSVLDADEPLLADELDGVTVVVVVPGVAAVATFVPWPEKARAASAEKAPVRARPPARTARVRPEIRRRPASRAAVRSFMGCSLGRPTGSTLRGSFEPPVKLARSSYSMPAA